MINGIVRQLESQGDADIPTERIGELVMEGLKGLDDVAYVRFASVYRNFREARDFNAIVGELEAEPEPPRGRDARGETAVRRDERAADAGRDDDERWMAAALALRPARPRARRAQPVGRRADRARRRRRRARRHRAGRAPARRTPRPRRGGRGRARRDALRDAGALFASRRDAALRRGDRRGGRCRASSARSRTPTRASPARGFALLRAAGIELNVGPGAEAARRDHRGHILRVTRGRPMVTLKLARTADGFAAGDEHDPRLAITGEAANLRVQVMRSLHDAIMIGVGTARERRSAADRPPARASTSRPLRVCSIRVSTCRCDRACARRRANSPRSSSRRRAAADGARSGA